MILTFFDLLGMLRVAKKVGYSKHERKVLYFGWRHAAMKANSND